MKKLKIYSTLLIVALLSILLLDNIKIHFSGHSWAETDQITLDHVKNPAEFFRVDSIEGGYTTTSLSFFSIPLYLRPYHGHMLKSHWYDAINYDGRQYTSFLNLDKVQLQIPASDFDESKILMTFCGVVIALSAIIFIWIMVVVFKTIRLVRRGEVFVSTVARNMERVGWMLVAYYLFGTLNSYLAYVYAVHTFHIAFHDIVFHNEVSSLVMILGFVLMIVSQVILLGKDLKEEQDLTI